MKLSSLAIIEMMIEEMEEIGDLTFPLCKHEDKEINTAATTRLILALSLSNSGTLLLLVSFIGVKDLFKDKIDF